MSVFHDSVHMNGILISPDHDNRCALVQSVDVLPGEDGDFDLKFVYKLLGCDLVQILDVDQASALAGHSAVLDEEGCLKPARGYLLIPQLYPLPLAGKVLLLGLDSCEGDMIDAQVGEEVVRGLVAGAWCDPRKAYELTKQHEDQIAAAYPGVIVVRTSESIAANIPRD